MTAPPKPAAYTETLPLCSSSQPVAQGVRGTAERQDAVSPKRVGSTKEEGKTAEEEEEEGAAEEEEAAAASAGFYSNWTRGSVRRATRQLEQKMKQEAPPLTSSPPSLSGGSSYSPRRPHGIPLAAGPGTREAPACSHVAAVSSVQAEEEEGGNGRVVKRDAGDGRIPTNESTPDKPRPADNSPLSTSPFASVNFLCLEGVTERESNPDWDCLSEGPHSDAAVRETWQTLCELGAFLQQVRAGGAFKARRAEQGFGLHARMARKRGGIQKRVSEVEARIRQAGLTPPSLMKRSASLAKLGCLELLANDFSEWELSHSAVSPSSAEAAPHPLSDESKKKRVQNSPSSEGRLPNVGGSGAERVPEAELTSQAPQSPLSGQGLRGAPPPDLHQNSVHVPGATLKITRQQYGRTHPLRRLKKRTASTFYHTM